MIEETTEHHQDCQFIFTSLQQMKALQGNTTERADIFIQEFIKAMNNKSFDRFEEEEIYSIIWHEKQQTNIPLCGKIFQVNTIAFRCKQCGINDGCIICADCFQQSDHEGHHFEKIQATGSCDCGDEEKWKNSGSCPRHKPITENIMIDENETEYFIKEIKLVFYSLFTFYDLAKHNQKLLSICKIFGKNFMKKLKQFNEKSLISNKMTHEAFTSPYEQFYPKIVEKQISGKTILDLVWQLQKLNEMIDELRMIFISMFTLRQFKEIILLSFIKKFNQDSSFIMSDFRFVGVQVFALEKTIQKVFYEGKWQPLVINMRENNFQTLLESYLRYYYRIINICELTHPLNEQMLTFQFMNSNICTLSGYQEQATQDKDNSMNHYRFQFILVNRLTKILRVVSKNKKLLKKMINDCISEILNIKKVNYFISCQRTLSYCLLVLCDGDVEKLLEGKLLEEIGVGRGERAREVVMHILASVREAVVLGCYCLSNQQTMTRYSAFWTFTFNRLPVLMSLDLFLMRFCFGVLRQVGGSLQRFVGHFVQVAAKALKEENLQQHSSLNYDRKKGCGFLCAAVGLLMEAACCDLCSFTMVTELGTHSRGDARRVYGSLLASVEPIKLSDFVHGLSAFSQEKLFFEDFLQACTTQDAGKLCLSPDSRCRPFSLKYLKSKKTSKAFSEMLQLNEKKVDEKKVELDAAPALVSGAADFRQLVFSEAVVDEVVTLVEKYLGALVRKPELLDVDTGNVTLLVEELARLLGLVPSRRITAFMDSVLGCEVGRRLPEGLRRHLQQLVGKKVETDEAGQQAKKDRLQQKKAEKLKEMKARRGKFLEKQEVAEEEVESSKCIICKVHVAGEPLAFMSLVRKSNTFARQHLNSSGGSFCVSSCNHLIHAKCYREFYNPFEHNYCNFCSAGSNLLVFMDGGHHDFMPSLEQLGTMTALLDKNHADLLDQYGAPHQPDLTVPQKLLESLALSILQGLFWDPEFYFRQQHGVHHLLFKLLRNLGGIDAQGLKEKIDNEMKQSMYTVKDFEQCRQNREHDKEERRAESREQRREQRREQYEKREHDKEQDREQNREKGKEQKNKREESREQDKEFEREQSKEESSKQRKEERREQRKEHDNKEKHDREQEKEHDKEEKQKREEGKEEKSQLKPDRQKSQNQRQSQKKQPVLVGECWAGYRFLVQRLLLLVKDKSEGMEDEAWSLQSLEQQLPPGFRERLEEAVHLLQQELKEEEVQELAGRQPLSRPALTRLPESLAELAKEIGKCPNCSDLTNELAKCLLCDFKSCLGCKVCGLKKHASIDHCGFSIFLRVDNGRLIYITPQVSSFFPSLYKNYLGQDFDSHKENSKFKYCESSGRKVFKDIARDRIQQETWYKVIRAKSQINSQI